MHIDYINAADLTLRIFSLLSAKAIFSQPAQWAATALRKVTDHPKLAEHVTGTVTSLRSGGQTVLPFRRCCWGLAAAIFEGKAFLNSNVRTINPQAGKLKPGPPGFFFDISLFLGGRKTEEIFFSRVKTLIFASGGR